MMRGKNRVDGVLVFQSGDHWILDTIVNWNSRFLFHLIFSIFGSHQLPP